jgi:hypothetical protein
MDGHDNDDGEKGEQGVGHEAYSWRQILGEPPSPLP